METGDIDPKYVLQPSPETKTRPHTLIQVEPDELKYFLLSDNKEPPSLPERLETLKKELHKRRHLLDTYKQNPQGLSAIERILAHEMGTFRTNPQEQSLLWGTRALQAVGIGYSIFGDFSFTNSLGIPDNLMTDEVRNLLQFPSKIMHAETIEAYVRFIAAFSIMQFRAVQNKKILPNQERIGQTFISPEHLALLQNLPGSVPEQAKALFEVAKGYLGRQKNLLKAIGETTSPAEVLEKLYLMEQSHRLNTAALLPAATEKIMGAVKSSIMKGVYGLYDFLPKTKDLEAFLSPITNAQKELYTLQDSPPDDLMR